MITTRSMCPVCYKFIDAEIYVDKQVTMHKHCTEHGDFFGVVESDPLWFGFCFQQRATDFYPGTMIDVTDVCNIRCKYCYHSNGSFHKDALSVVSEAVDNIENAPFLLSGGEPTTHPDFFSIYQRVSSIGEAIVLTNGIKLADESLIPLV